MTGAHAAAQTIAAVVGSSDDITHVIIGGVVTGFFGVLIAVGPKLIEVLANRRGRPGVVAPDPEQKPPEPQTTDKYAVLLQAELERCHRTADDNLRRAEAAERRADDAERRCADLQHDLDSVYTLTPPSPTKRARPRKAQT